MTVSLISCNLPAQELAFTNFAYVSSSTYITLKNLSSTHNGAGQLRILVKNLVLNIEVDERVAHGELALNRLHRQFAKIESRERIEVELAIGFGTTGSEAAKSIAGTILLEAELFVGSSQQLLLDGERIIPGILQSISNQVVTHGQKVSYFYKEENLLLLLTIKDVLSLDSLLSNGNKRDHSDSKSSHFLIIDSTNLELTGSKTGTVRFQNDHRSAPTLFRHHFSFKDIGIGGLDDEFSVIFRRAFASRVIPPKLLKELGIQHVKGLILHGPPGTGKTLIARQIAKVLKAREPKIVNGPEILNKYVGQSEENIRNLFKEAEDEYRQKGDFSALHIIILDELDAICKSRGAGSSGSTGVGDSVVNQLLSKIDGVNSINNILLIGMTNRLDLLDEALLRPGRFEVQIEIGLPDTEGRLEILEIHTKQMRESSRLANDVDLNVLAQGSANFSGAELEGLVRSATSFAFQRHIDMGDMTKPMDTENIKVCRGDFESALEEVHPAFGTDEDELQSLVPRGIIGLGSESQRNLELLKRLSEQIKTDENLSTLAVLLYGDKGTGKSALAAHVAITGEFPFTKLQSPLQFVGMSESARSQELRKAFSDAYKSDVSCIILDDIERLMDFTAIGPRFSNTVLQTIMILIKNRAPKGRKLLILATTSEYEFVHTSGLADIFNLSIRVPSVESQDVPGVLDYYQNGLFTPDTLAKISDSLRFPVPIKKLIFALELVQHKFKNSQTISHQDFLNSLHDVVN
ncbi:N-ethylmaleimide-sensitive factor (NSF1)-like AAA ATpase involved in vesicular transport [Cryptosporidium sp. chipmunk genotype I]|uniref:N-ethylmaleimide-sensitive factor (NSF1)-like AAA ATpase involved in vesicular transport n=1 Tax=Cryptosporidium sp. chipmunk genotype I TaxID=1280935 RepID=UPI00351AB05C|nr:N-ethylmaleimide-sensitive factor (NSF1)-like AAA ATpase involved in vesicular transport [Cryptosporidium sp. chipmunk genotype I]